MVPGGLSLVLSFVSSEPFSRALTSELKIAYFYTVKLGDNGGLTTPLVLVILCNRFVLYSPTIY